MSCDDLKTSALAAFNTGSYSSGVAPIEILEQTKTTEASLLATKGQYAATIPANTDDFILFVKTTAQTDGQSNSPPTTIDGKFRQLEYHKIGLAGGATAYQSSVIPSDNPSVTFGDWNLCPATPTSYGWLITDKSVVCSRLNPFPASFAGLGGGPAQMGNFGEYFTKSETQSVGTEAFVTFDKVKTDSSGASVGYPDPTATGGPVDIASTSTIQLGSTAKGFDASRFPGEYRPCILLKLDLGISKSATSTASSMTIKLYINNTLVKTATGDIPSSSTSWSFSVKGVGDYGTSRPPQNNPADSYEGWSNPSVRVSVECDADTVDIVKDTKLYTIVVLYPFS